MKLEVINSPGILIRRVQMGGERRLWGAYPRSGGRTHKGTDIMREKNTPLVAVVRGAIVSAHNADSGLGGISITMTGTDGNVYYYARLTSIREGIAAGVHVTAGEVTGYAGNTGNAAGGPVHLHFEIRPGGGSAVDPYPTLRAHQLMLDPKLLVYLPSPTSTTGQDDAGQGDTGLTDSTVPTDFTDSSSRTEGHVQSPPSSIMVPSDDGV